MHRSKDVSADLDKLMHEKKELETSLKSLTDTLEKTKKQYVRFMISV